MHNWCPQGVIQYGHRWFSVRAATKLSSAAIPASSRDKFFLCEVQQACLKLLKSQIPNNIASCMLLCTLRTLAHCPGPIDRFLWSISSNLDQLAQGILCRDHGPGRIDQIQPIIICSHAAQYELRHPISLELHRAGQQGSIYICVHLYHTRIKLQLYALLGVRKKIICFTIKSLLAGVLSQTNHNLPVRHLTVLFDFTSWRTASWCALCFVPECTRVN